MKKMFLVIISISVALNSLGMRFYRERSHYGYENYLRPIDNSYISQNCQNQMSYSLNQQLIACPLISSPTAWNELKLIKGSSVKFTPLQPLEQQPIANREIQFELSINNSEWDKYINWNPEKPSTSLTKEISKFTGKKLTDSQLKDPILSGLYPDDASQPQAANNSSERSNCFISVNSQPVSSHLDYMQQPRITSNSSEKSSCFIPVNPQSPTLHFKSMPQTQNKSNSIEKSSESSSSNVHKSNKFKQIYHKQHKKRPSSGIRSYERLSLARRLTPAFTKSGYQNVFHISSATVNNDITYGLAQGIIKKTQFQHQEMYTFANNSTQP